MVRYYLLLCWVTGIYRSTFEINMGDSYNQRVIFPRTA